MKFLAAAATVLVMPVLMPAATTARGTPAAARYIGDDKVAATMIKGGPLLQDAGLTIVADVDPF
jgi:hypothetical protein